MRCARPELAAAASLAAATPACVRLSARRPLVCGSAPQPALAALHGQGARARLRPLVDAAAACS